MTNGPGGVQHDAAVLLRYRWFVVAILLIAVLTAIFIGLTRGSDHQSAVSAIDLRPSDRQPVSGTRLFIPANDLLAVAHTPEVAERAVRLLRERGIAVDPAVLLVSVGVADVTPPDLRGAGGRRVQFTVTHDDPATAGAYADAWAQAFADEASVRAAGIVDAQIGRIEAEAKAAAAELDRAQQALSDYLRANPEASVMSPSTLLEERSRVVRALARLRDIQARGGASPAEVQIALGDVFPGGTGPITDVGAFTNGLLLRLQALDRELGSFQGSGSGADQAFQLFRAVESASHAYNVVLTNITAARATKGIPPVDASVTQASAVSGTSEVGWMGLLAAAGALGIAIGVVGAFLLDYLARNRLLPWVSDPSPVTEGP